MKQTDFKALKKTIYLVPAIALTLAVPGCGTPTKVATAVGAIGGTASTIATTAAGAVVSTAKTASSVVTGGSAAPNRTLDTASAGPGAASGGGGTLPPLVVAGGVAASTASNTTNRSDSENLAIGSQISKLILAGIAFCERVQRVEYRVDCFADQLDQVAANTPNDADFGQARSIIANAANDLAAIAEVRASDNLPPIRLRTSSARSIRDLGAIDSAQLPAAFSEAERVLEQAETLLLRSSEGSLRRQLAYTEISEALGSAKVLLRST